MKKNKLLPISCMLAMLSAVSVGAIAASNDPPMTNNQSSVQKASPIQKKTSDSVITAKVKSQLIANKKTKAASISVITNEGIVSLSGTVDSSKEALTAIEIAAGTAGVKDVDASQLAVHKSKKPMVDVYLTAKVKGALLNEQLFGQTELPVPYIKVTTRNGVVYLNGTVKNQQQKNCAEQISASLNGVKKVVSNLKVKK